MTNLEKSYMYLGVNGMMTLTCHAMDLVFEYSQQRMMLLACFIMNCICVYK
jgi:hypothetical protein